MPLAQVKPSRPSDTTAESLCCAAPVVLVHVAAAAAGDQLGAVASLLSGGPSIGSNPEHMLPAPPTAGNSAEMGAGLGLGFEDGLHRQAPPGCDGSECRRRLPRLLRLVHVRRSAVAVPLRSRALTVHTRAPSGRPDRRACRACGLAGAVAAPATAGAHWERERLRRHPGAASALFRLRSTVWRTRSALILGGVGLYRTPGPTTPLRAAPLSCT